MDLNYQSEDKLFSKKNIISFLMLAILVLAIPVIVKLVQTQQILKSSAAADPITFTSSAAAPNTVNCTGALCTTTSPIIDLQVTSNIGSPPAGP